MHALIFLGGFCPGLVKTAFLADFSVQPSGIGAIDRVADVVGSGFEEARDHLVRDFRFDERAIRGDANDRVWLKGFGGAVITIEDIVVAPAMNADAEFGTF